MHTNNETVDKKSAVRMKAPAHYWPLMVVSLFLILVLTGVIVSVVLTRPLQVALAGLSEPAVSRVVEYFDGERWLGRTVSLTDLEETLLTGKNKPDILIAPWTENLAGYGLHALDTKNDYTMPRSTRSVGLDETGARLALPIAIDHVELAFRRDLFASKGLLVDDRILSFSDLDEVLARFVAKDFYPLLLAGGEDRALLDVVAAMVLSTGGLEAYDSMTQLLLGFDWNDDVGKVLIEGGPYLAETLDILRRWKAQGILHPEWLSFKASDVRAIAELRLSAACVMRLSEHRLWPVGYLRNWQSSPFPFKDPLAAGSALLAPVLSVSLPYDGRFYKKLEPLVSALSNEQFQESVVQDWGLAPAHSSVTTLDREASDLRFWAAASRRLVPGWDAELNKASLGLLAEAVRKALL